MSDLHDAEIWKLQAEIERLRLALREILERTRDPVIQAIGMDALGE